MTYLVPIEIGEENVIICIDNNITDEIDNKVINSRRLQMQLSKILENKILLNTRVSSRDFSKSS